MRTNSNFIIMLYTVLYSLLLLYILLFIVILNGYTEVIHCVIL